MRQYKQAALEIEVVFGRGWTSLFSDNPLVIKIFADLKSTQNSTTKLKYT